MKSALSANKIEHKTSSWFSFFIAPSPERFFNADRVHPVDAVSVGFFGVKIKLPLNPVLGTQSMHDKDLPLQHRPLVHHVEVIHPCGQLAYRHLYTVSAGLRGEHGRAEPVYQREAVGLVHLIFPRGEAVGHCHRHGGRGRVGVNQQGPWAGLAGGLHTWGAVATAPSRAVVDGKAVRPARAAIIVGLAKKGIAPNCCGGGDVDAGANRCGCTPENTEPGRQHPRIRRCVGHGVNVEDIGCPRAGAHGIHATTPQWVD